MERGFTIGRILLPFVLLSAGCAGDIDFGTGGPSGDGDGDATLSIVSPQSDAIVVRENRGSLGALVAVVDLTAQTQGPIVRVVYQLGDGTVLGEALGENLGIDVELDAFGSHTLVAIGYDVDGVERARESVGVSVVDPEVADCYGWLDLYGLNYERGPNNEGVPNPVTVTVPINGMSHRAGSRDTPRKTFFMDCTLARSLAKAAPILRARDIIEVVDYGVYNYRCIGSAGTPPDDCTRGISQHAYAKGIDIAGLTASDGTYYSVNDDWVIDPDSEETCAAPTEGSKDKFLHEAICALKTAEVWNIVLTPNYDSNHRNHFHVDMTTNSDFIEFGAGVDIGHDYH